MILANVLDFLGNNASQVQPDHHYHRILSEKKGEGAESFGHLALGAKPRGNQVIEGDRQIEPSCESCRSTKKYVFRTLPQDQDAARGAVHDTNLISLQSFSFPLGQTAWLQASVVLSLCCFDILLVPPSQGPITIGACAIVIKKSGTTINLPCRSLTVSSIRLRGCADTESRGGLAAELLPVGQNPMLVHRSEVPNRNEWNTLVLVCILTAHYYNRWLALCVAVLSAC